MPNYWEEEGSKNEYLQYCAEKGEQVVMLSVAYLEESDDEYDVSFEGLYADNDNMIDFAKKNKGNYIVFSPNFSVLAYNAYLSFPISYLGEFDGHYIDNHGKVKEMQAFLKSSKNRMSLRELLKYLYL